MKKRASYSLEMFAEALIPNDAPDPEGWVYDRSRERKEFLRHYRAACHWNDRLARMMANETPWNERPVPVADWSPKGMRAWQRGQMEPDIRELYTALETDGRAYRLFATACRKATP